MTHDIRAGLEAIAVAVREHSALYVLHLEREKLHLELEKQKLEESIAARKEIAKELRYIADRVQEYVEYAQHTVK